MKKRKKRRSKTEGGDKLPFDDEMGKNQDKDGKTVSTTAKVVVAKAQVSATATATGAITAGTRVGDLSITVPQAASNAGYTLDTKNVKVLINSIEETANYRLQSRDVVTVKVTATADKNHTFANGATTATATANVGTVS